MSVSRKMLLICFSFGLPIAVLVYLTVTNINGNIAFAQWELKGDAYQRPLEDLLHEIQSAQIVFNTNAAQVSSGEAKIEEAFQRLQVADQRLGADLQFTQEGLAKRHREHATVAAVHQEWRELFESLSKSSSAASAPEVNSKFEHLVVDIRTMITHMGDTSNLILDPDLDSYYLMDVTLLALPQTQDRLGRTVQYGYRSLQHGVLAPEEKIQLAVYTAMLQTADIDRVFSSSRTSLNEDSGFHDTSPTLAKNLPPALEKYQQANARFAQMTQQLSTDRASDISPAVYLQGGLEARAASFSYWNTAVEEEDTLLRLRISDFQRKRSVSMGLAFLAVLAASLLAFFLTRSITGPLFGIVRSLSPGATLLSVCVERISEASQNQFSDQVEAALICQELDANCNSMRQAVRELESQIHGRTSEASSPHLPQK